MLCSTHTDTIKYTQALKELLHHMHGFTHVWHMYLLIYMYMYMYYVRAYIHFKIYSGGVRHSENFCMDEIVEISVGALKFCTYNINFKNRKVLVCITFNIYLQYPIHACSILPKIWHYITLYSIV